MMRFTLFACAIPLIASCGFAAQRSTVLPPDPPEEVHAVDTKNIVAAALTPPPACDEKAYAAAFEAELQILEKPETAAKLAVFKKNLYEALQKQGFSKEEALRLAAGISPLGVGGR